MGATTTLVIDFGGIGSDEDIVQAELDERRNNGKTTFQIGDSVFFRVWSKRNYKIITSSGLVTKVAAGEVSTVEPEVVYFSMENTTSVRYPVAEIRNITWFGNCPGEISVLPGSSEIKVNAEKPVGICKITYDTRYDVWKLIPPANMTEDYAILVVISIQE